MDIENIISTPPPIRGLLATARANTSHLLSVPHSIDQNAAPVTLVSSHWPAASYDWRRLKKLGYCEDPSASMGIFILLDSWLTDLWGWDATISTYFNVGGATWRHMILTNKISLWLHTSGVRLVGGGGKALSTSYFWLADGSESDTEVQLYQQNPKVGGATWRHRVLANDIALWLHSSGVRLEGFWVGQHLFRS